MSARITPACRKTASTAVSEPARAAVCEPAALRPARERPLFIASTCFSRARRRAMRANLRGLPNDSTYMSTRSVASSSSHHSSRSLVETSALLPIETKAEMPSPRPSARSSSARPSAPLCDENPMRPVGNARGAKVALSPTAVEAMPRQFGPTSRAPCARIMASSCSWRSRPSGPISAKPAEITQSAFVPLRSASSAAASTCSPGMQTTHRSMWSGISSMEL